MGASAETVVVVGAGMAGLACARDLTAAGLDVLVVEKARGAGGRLSTRRGEGASLDLGAPFLSGTHPALAPLLRGARSCGAARPWRARVTILADDAADDLPSPNELLVDTSNR